MSRPALNLVVALPAEARPLRRHYRLVRDNQALDWPLYRRDQLTLLLTGVGIQQARRATRWLAQRQRQPAWWLNLGIAGHPTRAAGEAVLIDEILEPAATRRWRLASVAATGLPRERLYSVTRPDPEYRLPGLCDMEAAGFYASALERAPAGRILCLKLVSDNLRQPASRLNGRRVSALVEDHIPTLERLLAQLEIDT